MAMFPAPTSRLSEVLKSKNYESGKYRGVIHRYPYESDLHRMPISDSDSDCIRFPLIEEGRKLDQAIIRILSNTLFDRINKPLQQLVDFDTLNGKYLLICCFFVPLATFSALIPVCRSLIDSYDALRLRLNGNFEMILVVQTKTNIAPYNDEFVFDHFLSAFPPCLAIPFSYSDARHYLCSCIGLGEAIVVDPNRLVLQHSMTLSHISDFGSDWGAETGSPFLGNTTKLISDTDDALRKNLDSLHMWGEPGEGVNSRLLSLSQILNCHPGQLIKRFGGGCSTLGDLGNKLVGLYICVDGQFMEKLKEVHDHCLANNQELEILLVCMPFYDDPQSYMEDLFECVQLFELHSWFVFKYQSTICRRIHRIYGQASRSEGDRFIIIPPNCQLGELEGRAVINILGIDAYPFTRSIILEQRFKALRSLNPADSSLLCDVTSKKHPCIHNVRESIPTLQGKKFLLYLDHLASELSSDRLYQLMKWLLPKFKALGWEIVFVPLNVNVQGQLLSKLPWPHLPPSDALVNCVGKHFLLPEERAGSAVIAVAEDDKILSKRADRRIREQPGPKIIESLSEDRLYNELALNLSSLH